MLLAGQQREVGGVDELVKHRRLDPARQPPGAVVRDFAGVDHSGARQPGQPIVPLLIQEQPHGGDPCGLAGRRQPA
jgi:hypothetical protein